VVHAKGTFSSLFIGREVRLLGNFTFFLVQRIPPPPHKIKY
jgi:hypothetical protein